MPEINHPVNIVDFADAIANNPHNESAHWSLGCYNDLKRHIKEHYSIIQGDVCFYCKIGIRYGAYGEPIEHIVPKDDRPQWMFEPKNLALSCYPCNTKKNADNTLSDAGRLAVNYPIHSDGFSIYHPHFDNWNDHMEVFHVYFIRPISDKGRETFSVCDLFRFSLPIDKAKRHDWEEEPFRIRVIQQVLIDPDADQETIDQCTLLSNDIIRRALLKRQIMGN
jgi:hypothetical protein